MINKQEIKIASLDCNTKLEYIKLIINFTLVQRFFSKHIPYFQFSAGVTPGDIKIIETDASGAVRETAGLTFGENEIIPGEFQEDLDDERGGWDNKLDFLFSCISVSVGLGSKFFLSIR